LNKQERRLKKDSETIEKIRGRSPELFADKSDTTQTEDSLEVGVTLVADSMRIKELLSQYLDLDSARHINHSDKEIDLEQKAFRQQIFLNKQRDIEREIPRAGFKKQVQEFKGEHYRLKVTFDPNSTPQIKLSGATDHMIIDREKTIWMYKYIEKEITTWQAFKKLWPVWLGVLLVGILSGAGLLIKLYIK
jgi:hypothetical protein